MNILDLDDISTWEEIYIEFIKNDPYWSVIESALAQNADDAINVILQGLENRIECVKSEELLSLRQRCGEHFSGIYTHVAAYHACRPTNIESYLHEGIIPAKSEELIEEAKLFFNDPDAVTEAVKDIRKYPGIDYLDHGRGKIGFFISRTGSLESGYSQYLEYGSELFKCIANRLGEWAVQKLSKRGTPTLFRCALPVSWLDEFTTFSIANSFALEPLVQLLIRLRRPKELDGSISGAFLLTRAVPKELIIDVIDMTTLMTMNPKRA